MKDLLLGIDFGTGGCKGTLLDVEGEVIASRSRDYPTARPLSGWAEQDPADWSDAMRGVIRDLNPDSHGELAAVCLDSYTHGAVSLDERLRVIRPTIIWTDQRSVAECEWLNTHHGDLIFETTYQRPSPTWTLPQLMWLKANEPETLKRTRHLSFVKDYVRYLLTGEMAVDFIEAQGTLFWDMKRRAWAVDIFELTGLSTSVLPRVGLPVDLAGTITAEAAPKFGLREGLPVIMGTSDTAVEDYAAGAVAHGQCVLKMATAGNVNVMTSEPHPNPKTITYSHVIPNLWYTVTATNAAAACQRWFRDALGLAPNGDAYATLNAEAERSPVGANGVFFHPYLMGERSPYWDPNLRGSFTGLGMGSTRADMSRSLLEGVVFSLRDCFRTIEDMGLNASEFILIGGGAKSELWSQIACDVFNAPVKIPASPDASFGAALLAGVGAGAFANELNAVKICLKHRRTLSPNPENTERYRDLFAQYRKIHDALANVYGN